MMCTRLPLNTYPFSTYFTFIREYVMLSLHQNKVYIILFVTYVPRSIHGVFVNCLFPEVKEIASNKHLSSFMAQYVRVRVDISVWTNISIIR